ncbi:tyrosine-protein phosphatase [Actinacidiphila bryophytorum]|uniref:tyrosine-protein phosphatase n=1 Tax=Actinacidiphila bryophytorum TaxID=1436133 RepID=UPI002176CE46|nr:tyrosine-protein phosphatase [Actinacidiphila bryophytorum]UWE11410.1 tyrosine-protein phosphatase [Actinacidiphila bryophytorum]
MTQEVRQQSTPSGPQAEPELTGVRNFRDVGGLPTADGRRVRYGVLFRSGHLAHATAQDAAYLAGLGLNTVFDFRNPDDIALEGPDTALPGTRNLNMPLNDPADSADFWQTVRDGDVASLRAVLGEGRGEARMVAAYRKLVLERTAEHARMLDLLTEPGGPAVPALLHCAAGKDRAGTSMAIILLALGVERSAIEADYLESNAKHRRYKVVRGDGSTGSAIDPEVRKLLDPLFEARVEYLRAAFDTIEERWGSVDRYLAEGLGLTPERRAGLREHLLTAA